MIKRELYLSKIRPYIDKEIIKVMTGIRRCGKSTMLKLIQEELLASGITQDQILFLNFESKALPFQKTDDGAYTYIKEYANSIHHKLYLFADEIQELPKWEEFISACMIDFDIDIYITGSNAKLLSTELSTYLAGRYIEISIYPFSFLEVKTIMLEQGTTISDSVLFQHYLQYGGMPFLYQNQIETNAIDQYLEDVFDSIIIKDVIYRNKVRDVALFKTILAYFISDIAHTYSAENIRKYLKNEGRSSSTETLYNYIEYCKEACLLYLVRREDLVGKQLLKFQEKIYLCDHGLREAIYGSNLRDIQQVLENIVYVELLRRGYKVYVGKHHQYEVDFVAHKQEKRCYVQVTYLLAEESIIEREFRSLELIQDNYPKYVISMDEINQSRNGIKHMNIKEFLCMETYD